MPFHLFSIGLLLTCSSALAYIGSDACSECHATEYQNWQGSHHDLAMQSPGPDTVLGDFNDAEFTYNGITTRFFQRGKEYVVRTDGEDGKLQDFPVKYVFGVYPLQQYLLPLSRGRLQALSIAWDARPASDGGQRWYHLYPDEAIDFRDPLHWTGPYHNWNTRCAECHSTDVRKGYNPDQRSYATTFEDIDVGCEACHGPGENHRQLAEAGELEGAQDTGFPTTLGQRGNWAFDPGSTTAQRQKPLRSQNQIDSCARCHSRRGTLGDYHYGADLLDTHQLSLLHSPLYHPDGQIQDEVYVYGSFLQSKMHGAGVVCSNCHEPHSLALRAEGNGTCAQCHKADIYDTPSHHHHPASSDGAQCANCHMPETTYMGVDPRRDHSLRIPRPDLSLVIGTPNACNMCHTDRNAQWALDSLRSQGVHFRDTGNHLARAFHQLASGDARAIPSLNALATDTSAPTIWRATALDMLGQSGSAEVIQIAAQSLQSGDPLLRSSAVRALDSLPLPRRFALLEPLVDDPITSVRIEVAQSLAGVPLEQLAPDQASALRTLFDEFLEIQGRHTDMPGIQLQLGAFYGARGDYGAAEAAYREALHLNPLLLPARLNYADLLRSLGREEEARRQLLKALDTAPDNGNVLHALGLAETRGGNTRQALEYLGQAAELEQQGTRHRFVYAIALHDLGKPEQAITQLQALLRQVPNNEDVLMVLADYSAEQGNREQALRYARKLVELYPGNPNYQRLYRSLGGNQILK